MNISKNKKAEAPDLSAASMENNPWGQTDIEAVKEYVERESARQSPERILRNQLLGIKYQMQDYIKNDNTEAEISILDFVKLYLRSLKITQRQLANAFEMKDTNLYKYLKGERKLNTDIVLKLSAFSHTQPELWFFIQTKNELLKLSRQKENFKKYEKYDYLHILETTKKKAIES